MLASRGGVAEGAPAPKDIAHSEHRGKIINIASLVSYQGKLFILLS